MKYILYVNALMVVGCHGAHSIQTGYPSEALLSLAFICCLLMEFIFNERECVRCPRAARPNCTMCEECGPCQVCP